MKFLILHPMGCYGIFVAWLLENANKSKEEIVLPFNQTGNAHRPVFYDDRYLVLMDTHDLEVFAKSNATIGTHHPDLGTAGFLRDNRDSRNGMKIVYLDYNFHTDRIWIQNNYFSKVYKSFFQILDAHDSNFVKHMKSWGDKPFEQYEPWEVREGLSYVIDEFLPPSNNGARDLLNVNDPYDVGFYTTVTSLRDNFIQTTTKLLDYCNLSYNLETLEYIKDAWLASQKHLYKDTLIKEYVEKILNNEPYTFKNDLTIVDEAHIQKMLREKGVELRCCGLNQLPKNSQDFQSIMFYNFDTLVKNNFNNVMISFYNKKISHEEALQQISRILEKLS